MIAIQLFRCGAVLFTVAALWQLDAHWYSYFTVAVSMIVYAETFRKP